MPSTWGGRETYGRPDAAGPRTVRFMHGNNTISPLISAIEELYGEIEYWSMVGTAIFLVMVRERTCHACRERHVIFVNYQGSTRCFCCWQGTPPGAILKEMGMGV